MNPLDKWVWTLGIDDVTTRTRRRALQHRCDVEQVGLLNIDRQGVCQCIRERGDHRASPMVDAGRAAIGRGHIAFLALYRMLNPQGIDGLPWPASLYRASRLRYRSETRRKEESTRKSIVAFEVGAP